jgi:hypothetical protein
MFAHWSHGQSGDWFVVPALFALCLALTDVAFVLVCFKETLPKVCLEMTSINCNYKLCNYIFPDKFRVQVLTVYKFSILNRDSLLLPLPLACMNVARVSVRGIAYESVSESCWNKSTTECIVTFFFY